MGRFKDLTGQKFGHLTVIKRVENRGKLIAWECLCDCGNTTIVCGQHLTRKNYRTTSCGCRTGANPLNKQYGELTPIEDLGMVNGKHMYKCRCSCGNIKDVNLNNLTNGHTSTCGDKRIHGFRSNWNDLTGQRFGKLTVLEETDKRIDDKVVWKCLCDCGNITEVISANLTRGNTFSCGCYQKELTARDITGMRFGKLTALRPTEKRYGKSIIWECKCDCGTICEKPSNALVTGGVKSCGCLISYGEEKIRKLLNENNIQFETQKAYDSCRFENGCLAHFDFYINNNYLIEYDGEQHFFGWGWDSENLKIQQNRDAYKNQWCKENGIPLIRIPYTKLDTLCLEDLLLETTEFRVV